MVLTDQPGAGAWPITGATFILMHTKQQNGDTGRAVLRFFDWALSATATTAADDARTTCRMPASVIELVQKTWTREMTDASGQPIWPADKHADN